MNSTLSNELDIEHAITLQSLECSEYYLVDGSDANCMWGKVHIHKISIC
jgi:hypothetical protein